MLAIRLPAEIEARLDNLARATGRTKTFYAREAIIAHLDDLEDKYISQQRSIEIRASASKLDRLRAHKPSEGCLAQVLPHGEPELHATAQGTWDGFIGCLHDAKTLPVSIDSMNQAIAEAWAKVS